MTDRNYPRQEKPDLTLDIGSNDSSREIPSLHITTSPAALVPPVSPYTEKLISVNKTQSELQKLLAHLLSRLKLRDQPPSVYEGLRKDSARKLPLSLGAVVETVRSAVRLKQAAISSVNNDISQVEDDTNFDNDQDFATDDSFGLLTQLRDLLILSHKQGQQILGASDENPINRQKKVDGLSPSRGSRPNLPTQDNKIKYPELLMQCIDLLSSIVLEDGRYKVSSPRLFRPTFALQAVCLDIACILIDINRDNPKVLSLVGFAMIPAFNSFPSSLHERLLSFFENSLIRRMLSNLQDQRGLDDPSLKGVDLHSSHGGQSKNPIVAIQVDEAIDDQDVHFTAGWKKWSSTPSTTVHSSVAPSQSAAIYYLSSLVPPLLAAMLDVIDPFRPSQEITILYRFCGLLKTIIALKQDAYLDILEVVAYHSATTRFKALSILNTFWPRALGHIVIGKPLPTFSYADILALHPASQRPSIKLPIRDSPFAHEFLPWLFTPRHSTTSVSESNKNACDVCRKTIDDFGLLCSFCHMRVHLNCYDAPEGVYHGQYEPSPGSDPRPCFFSFSHVMGHRKDITPSFTVDSTHKLRQINLFTLSLCGVCFKPLWGCYRQGLKCVLCHKIVHVSCAKSHNLAKVLPLCEETVLNPSNITIDFAALKESFMAWYRPILVPEDEMAKKPYEEISVYYSLLWTQLQILENGIRYGTINIHRGRLGDLLNLQRDSLAEFDLHRWIRVYKKYLSSNRLIMSDSLADHLEFNRLEHPNGFAILYDWSFLTSIISIIKSPLAPDARPTDSNLLQVSDIEYENTDADSHPYELVSLSYARTALALEFNVQTDIAARHLLSHIHQLGFFERIDGIEELFDRSSLDEIICMFPLPAGLDLSTSVETLVVAIQACLSDIDITINEHGFLLLARRFEPTGAASEYALTRLTKIVLSWICSEDDRLIIVARDYIAQRLDLPGVRTAEGIQPWPSTSTRRANTNVAMRSGGEYVICRRQLLSRYAIPWLASAHELDPVLYADCLYRFCTETAESTQPSLAWMGLSEVDTNESNIRDVQESTFRTMTKIIQANVVFSALEGILTRWFDSQSELEDHSTAAPLNFKTLPRLFDDENIEVSRRTNTINDPTQISGENLQTDSWSVFRKVIMSPDNDGLERGLFWLRIMARSAVDIPIKFLEEIFQRAVQMRASIKATVLLLESTVLAIWPKTFSACDLQKEITTLHSLYAEDLFFKMRSEEDSEESLNFIRYSLVICLLAFGCERTTILSKGLLTSTDVQNLPQRRKMHARESSAPSVFNVDSELMIILSRYASESPDKVCVVIAKFLAILVSDSALLDQHEIDQFILANAGPLAECAWRFYDLKAKDMGDTTIILLLRLLIVDSQPLNRLLTTQIRTQQNWQLRFQAVARLFRIILDMTNQTFSTTDRQWKTSMVDIINHFFYSLWLDDREEIRMGVNTWIRTLLPVHLLLISDCWDEYMHQAPIADRAKLASFLVQLHEHFPNWQVLPWKTILQPLLDLKGHSGASLGNDQSKTFGGNSIDDDETQVDSELTSLRASLLILSLQLLTDGASVDPTDLVNVKFVISRALGFRVVEQRVATPGSPPTLHFGHHSGLDEISFAIINPLVRLLDAPTSITLPGFQVGHEQNVSGLIGDFFVEIVAMTWKNLLSVNDYPYVVVRGLLEAMLLVVIKRNLNDPALRFSTEMVSDGIKNISNVLQMDVDYDIRRLVLSVMLSFLRTYPALAVKLLGHQINIITNLAADLRFNIEDPLVVRLKEYLEIAFNQYDVTGLFWLLSKQGRLPEEFFLLLRLVVSNNTVNSKDGELRDVIIRDTLSKIAANINDAASPNAIYNIERYVSLCHHQLYSEGLLQYVGLRLTAIARQAADLHPSSNHYKGFDPNLLFTMAATIMQHNKPKSTDLLPHVDTLLRVALTRFSVEAANLKELFEVVDEIRDPSKTHDTLQQSRLAPSVLDVLSDTLKGKTHVIPNTLMAMLEVVIMNLQQSDSFLPQQEIHRLMGDALTFMLYPAYRDVQSQSEFTATVAVGKLLILGGRSDFSVLRIALADPRSPVTVRVWNILLVAALECSDAASFIGFYALLPAFVLAYISSLRLLFGNLGVSDSAPLIVSHAFASIKLWILLARKISTTQTSSNSDAFSCDIAERTVWNELWPPFERLFNQVLEESAPGEKPPFFSFICSCVFDLILFVRQARSVIAMDTSAHMSILNSLRVSSFDNVGAKVVRAERSILEPPAEIPFDILISQTRQDVLAAEKLQALDLYKQSGNERRREFIDRGRMRDFRSA